MTEPGLVPIGAFAQAARVTVKALRHYDAVGLLAPAWVDPSSRYRYYRWSQLTDALCVTTLRDLGVPLDRIRRHLVDGLPLYELLADERVRLEQEIARAERALAVVDALRAEPELPVVEPDIVTWEERLVLTATSTAHGDTLKADSIALIDGLLTRAGELGVDTTAPVIGEYPLTLAGSMTIKARIDAPPGPEAERLPGGRLARVLHTGPYEALPLAYHGLVRWLHGQGHAPSGPVFEHYLNDDTTTPPERLRTEVLHRVP